MKDKIKCDDSIDCGTTCIRGWHHFKDCPHSAKYKVTFKDGSVKMLCGVHKNKAVYYDQWGKKIEKVEKI